MKRTTSTTEATGINRTGMSSSACADQMRQVPGMTHPSRSDGGLAEAHAAYLEDAGVLGSVPPPASARGAFTQVVEALKGNRAAVLIDKTAERLAFERTGVRLYEALLEKFDLAGGFEGGPSREQLQTIRDEELEHARMLAATLEDLGADPTAVTPSADLVAIESAGIGSVLGDPRTRVAQCLHALMVAELVDGESWTLLRSMAQDMGQEELSKRFAAAEQEEQRHLDWVRAWLTADARAQAAML